MSIMQEQKMIDESLLLRYFEKEVSEEEKQKVEEWIRSSEANSRMAKQVAQIFVATRLLHNSKEASPQQALQNFWRQVERRKHKRIWRYIGKVAAILALPVLILTTIIGFQITVMEMMPLCGWKLAEMTVKFVLCFCRTAVRFI